MRILPFVTTPSGGRPTGDLRVNQDLRKTRWSRLSIRLQVPQAMGVFLLDATNHRSPRQVLLVGSSRNLRSKLTEILERDDLQSLGARAVHWVSDLSIEQARLAERLFIRRYNPPLNLARRSRYHDILAG